MAVDLVGFEEGEDEDKWNVFFKLKDDVVKDIGKVNSVWCV